MINKKVIDLLNIGIFTINKKYEIVDYNTNFITLTEYKKNNLKRLSISDLFRGSNLENIKNIINNYFKDNQIKTKENVLICELVKKSKQQLFIELTINDKIKDGKYLTLIFKDISEYKKDNELMHYYAYYDNLTKLPNRLLFRDRSELAIKQAKRLRELLCIMFIDIDDFKSINDNMGHLAGDNYLKSISKRLTKIIRETDTVSRWGGDEFLILIPQVHNVNDALLFAERIIESNKSPIKIDEKLIYPKTSIGISMYPEDGNDINKLIKNADNAMYQAKSNGKNQYQLFNDE